MTEYYYLNGKVQHGPFSLEELKDKGLTSETLVWTDNMENWQKLKDIPNLLESLNYKKVPPPPPSETEDKLNKTEVSGHLNVTTNTAPNPILEKVKPSNKALRFFLIWSSIHLFALITSYSEIDLFNKRKPRTDEFWPFVKVFEQKHDWVWTSQPEPGQMFVGNNGYFDEGYKFNGLFYRYDWSEFAVYVGGALLFFLFLKFSDKESIK